VWFGKGACIGILVASLAAPGLGAAMQTSIGGRQIDLDATLTVREVVEQDRDTTHEPTLEQLKVRFAAALTDWLHFDSTTIGSHGGPVLTSDPSGIYNIGDVFQSHSWGVDFDELYFDLFLGPVDVRAGMQKVSWGKLDRFQPNDLINPYAYNDPFLLDEAERKIGIPALDASYYLPQSWGAPPESRITAVWVPRYFPYRFPPSQCVVENGVSRCTLERWFPPVALPGTTFVIPPPLVPSPVVVPIGFRTENIGQPAFRLENSEIALRLSALVHDVDVALYYFHGFDIEPAFNLTAVAFGQPDPMSPIGVMNLSAETTLTAHFEPINSGGADFQYAFGDFTVRGEAAYVDDRPFARDIHNLVNNPLLLAPQIQQALILLAQGKGSVPIQLPPAFAVRDAVEWGLGGDYTYEGYLVLLQVNQTDVINNDVPLLIKNIDTRLLLNLRKNFLADTLRTRFVAVQGIESGYTFFRPVIGYQITDQLGVEAGYLFISGRSQSVVGQYKNNKEAWFQVEYRL
jgi:hypothetical protein